MQTRETTSATFTLPSADGTANQVLQTNGSGVLSFSSVADNFSTKLLNVRDEKSSGTSGGSSSSGSFFARTLNTVVTNEISGASLSSNQITLPSGTYYIDATCQYFESQSSRTKLRNITDSSDTLIGSTEFTSVNFEGYLGSQLSGRFTIGATKTFEFQQRVQTSNSQGLGIASGFSLTEVYANVMIWKVA